jgi:hypothetical protein
LPRKTMPCWQDTGVRPMPLEEIFERDTWAYVKLTLHSSLHTKYLPSILAFLLQPELDIGQLLTFFEYTPKASTWNLFGSFAPFPDQRKYAN